MRTFKNSNDELCVATKAVVTSFEPDAKSELAYRFTATAQLPDEDGVVSDSDVSGYFAKSLGRTYKPGDIISVTCKVDILLGTDPSLENPGQPCNWLWSIARPGADQLSDGKLAALRALLG